MRRSVCNTAWRRAVLISTVGTSICGARARAVPNGRDQTLEFNRFGIELVASCGDGLLALAVHRMRGHADDWDVSGLRIVLETPHGFPTIVVRHFEVHQDHVGELARGQAAALLALLRCENLEAAAQLEAR